MGTYSQRGKSLPKQQGRTPQGLKRSHKHNHTFTKRTLSHDRTVTGSVHLQMVPVIITLTTDKTTVFTDTPTSILQHTVTQSHTPTGDKRCIIPFESQAPHTCPHNAARGPNRAHTPQDRIQSHQPSHRLLLTGTTHRRNSQSQSHGHSLHTTRQPQFQSHLLRWGSRPALSAGSLPQGFPSFQNCKSLCSNRTVARANLRIPPARDFEPEFSENHVHAQKSSGKCSHRLTCDGQDGSPLSAFLSGVSCGPGQRIAPPHRSRHQRTHGGWLSLRPWLSEAAPRVSNRLPSHSCPTIRLSTGSDRGGLVCKGRYFAPPSPLGNVVRSRESGGQTVWNSSCFFTDCSEPHAGGFWACHCFQGMSRLPGSRFWPLFGPKCALGFLSAELWDLSFWDQSCSRWPKGRRTGTCNDTGEVGREELLIVTREFPTLRKGLELFCY